MKRLWQEHGNFFRMHILLIAAALGFPLYRRLTLGIRLPFAGCLTHTLLHLYCPLCGGTRAVEALLHLQIGEAWRYNPLVVFGAVVALVAEGIAWGRFFAKKKPLLPLPQRWWILPAAVFVAYFLLRNLLMILWGIDPTGDLGSFWN